MNELKNLLDRLDDGEWYIPSATGLEKIVYTSGVGLEKFAELIVRECAVVADQWVNDEDNGRNLVSAKLKKHFGVEE